MKHKIISFLTLVILVFIALFLENRSGFWLLFCFVSLVYLVLTIYGSFEIRLNYFLRSINKTGKKGIILSFDDGPDPDLTPKILSILRTANIKASFFVIGTKVEKYSELVRAIHQEGHLIGNHSYGHNKGIGFFSTKKLMADIHKCSDLIEEVTGKRPMYFRPPFGVTNPRYSRALPRLGLTSVGWSVRSLDTLTKNKDKMLERIQRSIREGSILLLHDTQKVTLEALPAIIEHCNKNGIKIVSLQEDANPNEML